MPLDPAVQAAANKAVAPMKPLEVATFVGDGVAKLLVAISPEAATALTESLHAQAMGRCARELGDQGALIENVKETRAEAAIAHTALIKGLDAVAADPEKRKAVLAAADAADKESLKSNGILISTKQSLEAYFNGDKEGGYNALMNQLKTANQQARANNELANPALTKCQVPQKSSPAR